MDCQIKESLPDANKTADPATEIASPRALEADRLIGRKELCRFLGVSYTTVWGWIRSERFVPAIDINGIPKWRLSDVRAWVDARPRRAVKPLPLASGPKANGQVSGKEKVSNQ